MVSEANSKYQVRIVVKSGSLHNISRAGDHDDFHQVSLSLHILLRVSNCGCGSLRMILVLSNQVEIMAKSPGQEKRNPILDVWTPVLEFHVEHCSVVYSLPAGRDLRHSRRANYGRYPSPSPVHLSPTCPTQHPPCGGIYTSSSRAICQS